MSQTAPKARKPQTKAAQTGSPDAPVRKPAAKAAQSSPAKAPVRKPAAKAAQNGSADAKTRQFNEQLRRALDVASSPTMLIDRDLKITYANDAATALLKKHREHFQKLTRDFDPDNLIGVCIDVFHKDPSKQRRILADPSNLPHRADIHLGPLTFALCASATYDANGVYNGNVFEWNDVSATLSVKDYTSEINRLADALVKLAEGDLNVNFKSAAGNNYTEEVKQQFDTINASKRLTSAIGSLVSDAGMLSNAAMEDSTRVDATKHQGDFRSRRITAMFWDISAAASSITRPILSAAGQGADAPQQLAGRPATIHFRTGDCRTDKCCYQATRPTSPPPRQSPSR